jgi:hypothetical protein
MQFRFGCLGLCIKKKIMNKYLCLIAIIFLGCKSNQIQNPQKINVLFIGNSLTYYHDMPLTLQAMLNENFSNYNIEQSTFPGMTLDSHLNSIITKRKNDDIYTRLKENGEITETEKKLKEKKWDIVIIQENPGYLYFPDVVEEYTKASISKIKNLVENKNCKFILFKTWISKQEYPTKQFCALKSDFDYIKYPIETTTEKYCTYTFENQKEEIKIINNIFESIAHEFNFHTTNHLHLHNIILEKFPEIKLYEDDGHPNENGSFLNALEFYSIITNKSPKKLKYIGNLDTETAEKLKNLF